MKETSREGAKALRVLWGWLVKLWACWIWRMHDWTCAAEQGIPPTREQVEGGVEGFWDYATMYCKRCGKVSELSKRGAK